MPQLSERELVNPSVDPIHYPGNVISSDALLVGSWTYRMTAKRGGHLYDYSVVGDGGSLGTSQLTLSEALEELGAEPAEGRYPVVAVGSNAAPGQLAHKFGKQWQSAVIPVTTVDIGGISVGYSAHINRAGYMPYAPIGDSNGRRLLVVLWLDDEQLAKVTETEPNYYAATLSGRPHAAVLGSGESLSRFIIYRARWGVYRHAPGEGALKASSQEDAYQELGSLDWFNELVPEMRANGGVLAAMKALADDPRRRDTVKESFSRRGHRMDDGLPPLDYSPLSYGGGAAG